MSQIMHDVVERLISRTNAFIQNNEQLWEEGMKLTLLESKDFLGWYEKPKYWAMYKPIKGNQTNFQLVKLEVSNKACSQFSQSSKRGLPCEFEYNNAVKIQTFEEYQYLLNARIALQNDIKGVQKEVHDQTMIATLEQNLRKISVQYFGLLNEWKIKESTCRIIILARGEQFKDLNYFIYNEQTNLSQMTKMQIKTPLTKNSTDPQMLRSMAEIIKIHHFKRKNQAILQKFQRKFKQSIGSSFTQAFKDHKEQIQKEKKKLSQNEILINSFRKYQYKQSKSFIQKWKNAVKNVKVNLFIQIFTIFINKEHIPESVKLVVDGTYQKVYDYQYFQNDYLVYIPSTKNEQKFFKISIQNSRFCRPINFQVQLKLKNSQTIRYDGEHIVYILNKDESLFTQEVLLQNSINSEGQLSNQSTYCIIYLNQLFSKTQNIQSLVPYFQSQIFLNTGQIPSKYLESYKIDYNPYTFKTIKTLLNNQSYSAKLSKHSFQRTYYQLVRLSQRQENLSQRSILLAQPSKRTNKFAMKDRFQIYTKKLLQGIGYYSKEQDFQYFFKKNYSEVTNNILSQKNISISKNQHKNFLQDLNLYNPKNISFIKNELLKFIYFAGKVNKIAEFPYQLRYSSHVIPIFQSLFELYTKSKLNDLGQSSIKNLENFTSYLLTFIAFFAKLYPYSQYNNLKADLYILRWLVQKKLPHFNDTLNRNNIGLQNFISEHLLHLFTKLPSQLTFRIWDLLISTQQRDQARILVAFTLLTFYQTTDMLPIIPINQFMEQVQANIKTISVDKQFAAKFAKIADTYYLSQKIKQERLIKHIKSEQSSIVDDRILKRIILGQSKLKIPYQQEGKVPLARAKPFQKDNFLTIKQLRYPLPEPNYFGSTIIQIIFFLHDLHILENINLNTNKYWLKFYIKNTEWKDYTKIINKDYFYNKSIRIPSQYINFFHITEKNKKAMIQRHVKIDIVTNVDLINHDESRQKTQLKGFIDYSLYNKDKAYKLLVNLSPQTLHNKGRTILNLTMCLKSHEYDCSLTAKSDFSSLQTLSEKLLDYDIGKSNECITARNKLCSNLQKIKYPLDQFSSDQYKRVINQALNQYECDWLQSSITSIEQLKAIFYNVFSQERDKSIKHQFSKFYQIFAQEHNMQYVYFAQILVRFILLSNISRKKKLMYLFCLGVHYQNCYSKKLNSQTINSLVRLIFKQHCLINALPMVTNSTGKIIEAYYFESDLKTQSKKDFTDIVQDWAYICNFKYGYSDIILGSARDLSILRSFFDAKTLKKMESQKQCRFEIIYQLDGFRYIWSATVDPKTFAILKRGTKFLNQFTGYSNIKYLDSTQQYLLNCENVIPLHNHRSYTYEQFTEIMLSNHLVRYFLDLPPPGELSKKRQEEQLINIQWQEDKQVKKEVNEYNSWAICRGQNCLQSWHRCKVTKTGKIMSKVIFQFDKGHQYNVATLDLISMDEIDIHSQKK